MNLQVFTELIYEAYDEGREKDAALLAFEWPELYREYAVVEGLIEEDYE
jgi:hypothetical protein